MRPVKPVVCPARPENMNTHVGPPETFLLSAAQRGQAESATITVTYTGFTPQAQAAFQYAIDVWKSLIASPVTIHVNANWTKLAEGVLGSAGPSTVVRNFPGAPQADVWYPIALAEKIAGQDLNGEGVPEINANFSTGGTSIVWYYGTDGNTPAGKYDLASVVLHELCHGLGFIAGTNFDTTNNFGSYGFSDPQDIDPLPYTFSTFMENQAGQRLTDTHLFANPSAALGTQYTGGGLYFNSPLATAINTSPGDKRPRLYAPAQYSTGSSVSHMDENTYPAGSENSLMTFAVGKAEAIHNPGPLVLKMFDEMGWFVTAIHHTPLPDVEIPQKFLVLATVQSDGTITPGSVRLNYSLNNSPFTSVAMAATGPAGQYQASIPDPGTNATVRYYLSAADNETGRTYTAPGQPAPGVSARSLYQFTVGPDVVAPTVAHTPPNYLFATKLPYELVVRATDNIGVAGVSATYSINGVERPALTLTKQADGVTYRGSLSTAAGPIVAGDELQYRIVATDQAANVNQTSLGPFTVPIVGLKPAQNQYVNNFGAATSDFVGTGFSVTQPAGFSDPAIHSSHPYADKTTLTYQLLVPVIVSSDLVKATIKFDEIVLVEPGETGSTFGSATFFDYVVVEASLDGDTWTPLAAGYDSRARPAWLAAWNSAQLAGNSTAVGTPDLYASRSINLLNKYAAGTAVQLRFRLFADDGAHGWGWAIDNLNIQGETVLAVRPDVLTANGLNVYPNPSTTGQLQVQARLAKPTSGLRVQVHNALGQQVLNQALPGAPSQFDQPLDLSALPGGLYLVSLSNGNETVTRKIVLEK